MPYNFRMLPEKAMLAVLFIKKLYRLHTFSIRNVSVGAQTQSEAVPMVHLACRVQEDFESLSENTNIGHAQRKEVAQGGVVMDSSCHVSSIHESTVTVDPACVQENFEPLARNTRVNLENGEIAEISE